MKDKGVTYGDRYLHQLQCKLWRDFGYAVDSMTD